MASGYTFGAAKPAETTGFGQTAAFGTQFGTTPTAGNALPQFGSTFGTKAPSSGGFQFSTSTTTAPATFGAPSFNFNPTTQPTLKSPTTNLNFAAPAPTGALAFRNLQASMLGTQPTEQAPSLFGMPPPTTNTGLTFGIPKSTVAGFPLGAPAVVAPNTGMTFGAPAPSVTGTTFGTPALPAPATGLSFSTSAPSTGLTFGTSIPSTGLTFNTSTPSTGLTFNTPTPSTGMTFNTSTPSTGLTFNTAAPSTGLTFGTSAASTGMTFGTSIPSTGLTFSTSIPAQPASGTGFSTVISSAANVPKPSFGMPASSAPRTTLSFMPPQSSAPIPVTGLTFATPASTTPSLFPAPLPLAATTAPSFPASTTGGSVALNLTTTAATTTSTAFNLGGPITTTASDGLSFGLGGTSLLKPSTTTGPTFGAQPITTATSTPQTIGLGGVSATPPKLPATTTAAGQPEIAPKDQVLPNELMQTVEHFKKFLQEQKAFSSEIARFSMKDLKRVETDTELINNYINEMKNELQKNKAVADTLQLSTAKDLQNAEMAQRTFDTPAGLQYENTAPFHYFLELSSTFEKDMYDLKARIENIDKHVRNTGPPTALNSQDLAIGMRRLHETFVALAGRLQSLHNQVEYQKEQYLNLRRQVLNDYTNVFESPSKELEALEIALDGIAHQPPLVSSGPTPFSSLGNSQAQIVAQNPPPGYPATTPLGAPTTLGFNTTGQSNNILFGSNPTNTSSLYNVSSAFQLQKPPVGNKRGKP